MRGRCQVSSTVHEPGSESLTYSEKLFCLAGHKATRLLKIALAMPVWNQFFKRNRWLSTIDPRKSQTCLAPRSDSSVFSSLIFSLELSNSLIGLPLVEARKVHCLFNSISNSEKIGMNRSTELSRVNTPLGSRIKVQSFWKKFEVSFSGNHA